MRATVAVFLRQAEVNDVHEVALLAQPHQEVVRLHVAMDEVLAVNVLDPVDQLIGEQQHRLQLEFAPAEVEEILEAGAQELHHHHIVLALRSRPFHDRNADCGGERESCVLVCD